MSGPEAAKKFFEASKVRDAQRELTAYLRERPTDTAARTFLFELLCFSGDFDRAQKQLSVLAEGNADRELGAILYYSALHAEKTRHETFEKQQFSKDHPSAPSAGVLNGRPFESLRDADPDLGARLEVFAAGSYLWIPFEHIDSLEVSPPRRLRDTLWAPAVVKTGPSFQGADLGEVLLPAIYPFSWKDPDEAVWLGRVTSWTADDAGNEYPSGQKTFLVDGQEVPLLEVRSLQFSGKEAVPAAPEP